MDFEKNLYKTHVFVCTNERLGKSCCEGKGSVKLREDLKRWALQRYGSQVRVNASGCMGQCAKGIAISIYPQEEWILNCNESDIEVIKEKLQKIMDASLKK